MPREKAIPEPEPTYDVEFIRKARVTADKAWEYYIKWGGYPEEDNSWEPEENLSGCKHMLKSFWKQIGSDFKIKSKILPLDFEVTPTAEWIDKKRKAYSKTAAKKAHLKSLAVDSEEEEEEEEEGEEEEKEEEEEWRPRSSQVSKKSQTETDSDSDNIPLSSKVKDRRQTFDDASSDDTSLASERISTRKHKLQEQRGLNDGKKRPRVELKRFGSVAIPDSSPLGSRVSGNSRNSSRMASPLGSLFGDSDSGSEGPVASKSSTLPGTTASDLRPTEPPPNRTFTGPSSVPHASTLNKPMPAHLQRKLYPRVKPMPSQISQPDRPLGISTKARLSRLNTGNLGPWSADSVSSSVSPSVGNPLSSTTSNGVASEPPKAPQASGSTDFDANKWLQENTVSMEPANYSSTSGLAENDCSVPPSNTNTHNLHFSKRWRWTGPLVLGNNETVGKVLLTDNTPLDSSISQFGIQLLLPQSESLCLHHSYPIATLPAAMVDFKISQFARMSANQPGEEQSFCQFVAYMTKHELYSRTPLFVEGQNAATMFIFPASFEYLWDQLGVPPKVRLGQDLLVAIGIQIYEPPGGSLETYTSDWKSHFTPETVPESSALDCSWALQALTFPEVLYKRIAHKECTLFTSSADKGRESPDTLALITVLNNAPGCNIVPILNGSARFIFIHVGAWDILHKLIGLVDRRRRRQDVQFYTYGSDPMVELKHWGMQEVFPCGGVVTFTPRAIAEDPEGVEKLISKLDEHPLWVSYIVPSVVAMIIEVVKSDNGPNSKLKGAVDALCGILMPIEKGQIALTWQPPPSRAWQKENDKDEDLTPKRITWMIDQGHLSELRGHDLLLECQKRLQQSPDRSEKDVESRIVKDMLVMQSELRREYRRFVIITDSTGVSNASREAAAGTSASKADIKDGFEFTHMDEFTFNDDYMFGDS